MYFLRYVTHSYTVKSMICIHNHSMVLILPYLKKPYEESDENITTGSYQAKNIISLHSKFDKLSTSFLQYQRDTVLESTTRIEKIYFNLRFVGCTK